MPKFLALPDKEKNYQGYMLYALIVIWTVITGLVVSAGFYFFPYLWQRWTVFLFTSLFIAVLNLLLNYLGYTRIASWSFIIMLWLYISIPCYSAGGIMAPGILMQISVILTAAFLLGWKGGVVFGLLTFFFDFGLVYLQLNDSLPNPAVIHNPLSRWISAIIAFGTILALQYYATNHLHSGLIAMKREMLKREEAEKIKDEVLYQLGERVKELKTLYQVSQILHNEEATYKKLISDIVIVIPGGWQYPDITAARVCVDEIESTSPNYKPSPDSLQAEMETASGTKVTIEVVYLQLMQASDEGPFLKEERNLINMLAEMIKIDLERRERKVELQDYKYALNVSSIIGISGVEGVFTFVNENFCKISKYRPDELIGQHHSIIWSGLHPPDYFIDVERALQNGTPFRGEFCNKAKDNSLYWVDSTIVPFLDENRKVFQYLSINYDITKRKEAEYLIKEQAETFRAIVENTKESIYLISPDYKLLQFNSTAFERIYENRGLELQIGADFRNYLFAEGQDIFYSMFKDSLHGIYRTEEIMTKGVNNNDIWFQSKTSPVYKLNGELIGIKLLTESINDRKYAEAILKESEEKFRSIVEQSLVGIYIIQAGKLVYVNPGFEKIFGYSKEQLLYKSPFEELVHEDDINLVRNIYNKRINSQEVKKQYTFRAIRYDKAVIHLEVIASLISYNNKPAIIGTLVNITDRIQEERRINKAVLDAQENERLQIGMELHDNVKQILAGSGIFLEVVQNKLDDKEVAFKILSDLKKYNADAITELRRLSHQLAPLVEENTRLEDKIDWLIKSLKVNEILSVSVSIGKFKETLDNNIQLNIYRILQEQLSNILKYAYASVVEINIHSDGNTIYFLVKDNGKGFDLNAKKEGIGLENIRRRVQMLEGKVEIVSSPGQGCEINIQIPYKINISKR